MALRGEEMDGISFFRGLSFVQIGGVLGWLLSASAETPASAHQLRFQAGPTPTHAALTSPSSVWGHGHDRATPLMNVAPTARFTHCPIHLLSTLWQEEPHPNLPSFGQQRPTHWDPAQSSCDHCKPSWGVGLPLTRALIASYRARIMQSPPALTYGTDKILDCTFEGGAARACPLLGAELGHSSSWWPSELPGTCSLAGLL